MNKREYEPGQSESNSTVSQEKAESVSHEDAGFIGGCPFPHAAERIGLRDQLLKAIGLSDARDDIFRG